ncbi:hypothetical protein [Nocardioides sp.]|uniref:hypothetical protein n=1 Tax=Nocardioides sp. TaxID=35761 RepID=UPI00286A30C8|nr:hypothetical protein [Nocardioides sp.]
MQRDNEDDAWRAIVENFGERADLDPDPQPETPPGTQQESRREPDPEPPPVAPRAASSWDEEYVDSDWSTDRFVPPPPPPVPSTSKDRMAAWIGIFGSPAVLLVCLVLAIDLPQLVAYALVAAFVGGFLYLVFQMPRGPRDPDDDGARI